MAVSFHTKTLYRRNKSWFIVILVLHSSIQVLIHTISTLTFRTFTQASLPYQDAVISIFKMAFKKAAMISCAKRICP